MSEKRAVKPSWIFVTLFAAAITGIALADQGNHYCARVTIMDHLSDEVQAGRQPFSASEIIDLYFYVEIGGNITGDHILELELYTPRGHLYQVLPAAITTKTYGDGMRVSIPGYPASVPLQHLQEVRQGNKTQLRAWLKLPVGGTIIGTSSLYGKWEVKVKIDGQPMTCHKPIDLSIVQ